MSALTCEFCSRVNPAGAKFCNECGSPLGLRPCMSCEAINSAAAATCHQCGADLAATPDEARAADMPTQSNADASAQSAAPDEVARRPLPESVAHALARPGRLSAEEPAFAVRAGSGPERTAVDLPRGDGGEAAVAQLRHAGGAVDWPTLHDHHARRRAAAVGVLLPALALAGYYMYMHTSVVDEARTLWHAIVAETPSRTVAPPAPITPTGQSAQPSISAASPADAAQARPAAADSTGAPPRPIPDDAPGVDDAAAAPPPAIAAARAKPVDAAPAVQPLEPKPREAVPARERRAAARGTTSARTVQPATGDAPRSEPAAGYVGVRCTPTAQALALC